MADTLYLEVAKDSGAILSFSNEQLQSSTSDFIECTEAELNYLNAMEAKLPAGMVTTLADLQDIRTRVKHIELLKFQLAQSAGKIARLKIKRDQIAARLATIQAERNALLKAGAARHGVTVAEYEAEMVAQYRASQAATGTPQIEPGKMRSAVIKQMRQYFANK
jgi:hypothetical protein